MNNDKVQTEQKEYSSEELELAQILDFYLPPFTLKSLAKQVYATEEQVREYLSKLGHLDLVSEERVAERERIYGLARQGYADLARATDAWLQPSASSN
jgi:hypothetical protein